ncbi:DUF4435 domain-containing protein [Desulfobacterales bacterium HSG16]|nr:DUF4435 domain-containing protein [Desulfobacterales bacterium HSG16]
MLDYATPASLVAEIDMMRTAFSGAILLLEGESDSKFFQKFIDDNHCNILIAQGKENAVDAIKIANSEGKKGALAIIDADFWRIDEYECPHDNLLMADDHDIESMIFNSEAFDLIKNEYCSKEKIGKFDDLKRYIYDRAFPIAVLRFLSHNKRLELVFKKIDYKKITEKGSIDIKEEILIKNIISQTKENAKNKGKSTTLPSDDAILEAWSQMAVKCRDYELSELCCGHDLTELFARGLRTVFANQDKAVANRENMEKVFRLSFDTTHFNKTALSGLIKDWEQNNSHFRILTD